MATGSNRAIIAAFLANLGIAIAKFIGFAITGAASMLAEAVHSLADTGNQALLLWGGVSARRAPTETHPFGYGRERYFWSFVVALVIFSLGSVFAIVEGIQKVLHPHELESPLIAVAILAFGIALESFSFRTAIHEAQPLRGKSSWWEFIHQTRNPELPVVLLEDLGALIGLVLALLGVGLAYVTHDPRFDALGSIAIGILLGGIAIVLALEMKSLLIGESAHPEIVQKLQETIASHQSVKRLIHLRTLHLGPEEILVAAKLEFDGKLSFAELAREIDAVEARLREQVPKAKMIFLEPDVHRTPTV